MKQSNSLNFSSEFVFSFGLILGFFAALLLVSASQFYDYGPDYTDCSVVWRSDFYDSATLLKKRLDYEIEIAEKKAKLSQLSPLKSLGSTGSCR